MTKTAAPKVVVYCVSQEWRTQPMTADRAERLVAELALPGSTCGGEHRIEPAS